MAGVFVTVKRLPVITGTVGTGTHSGCPGPDNAFVLSRP